MTATYPSGQKSFSRRTDAVDDILATDVNQAYDEIEALETELGLNPADKTGGTAGTYATVKARLDKAHRAATFVVAASDAAADSKQFADYVCDGTADDVQIQAAIDALAAVAGADVSKPSGGGKVVLSEGTFNCSTGFDLDGKTVTLEGQGRQETLINFTCAGPCFKLDRNVDQRSRVTLEGFTIYGDDTNTTYGVQLESTAALNRLLNLAIYDITTAAVRGDSGNSQNYFERVFVRGCNKGFDMLGNNNTYVDCLVTNASGDVGTGPGFRSSESQSAYFGCFSERYDIGYDIQAFAKGTSFLGCSAENCNVSYQISGTAPNQPTGTLIFGGTANTAQHASSASVIVGRSDGTVILGLAVLGTVSGKDFNIISTATDPQIIGGSADGATPLTNASTSLRVDHLYGFGSMDLRPITDPGGAGAIPVTASGSVALVTAGAETRTLAAPTFIGQELTLYCKTFVGNAVVTCATTVNEAGNNTITFSATGQACRLYAVEEGSTLRWRLTSVDGAALSTV